MSEPQTVLEHLFGGRDALVLEVQRLVSAIADLDSVIVRIAGEAVRPEPFRLAAENGSAATPSDGPTSVTQLQPQVEVEATAGETGAGAAAATVRRAAKKAPARKVAQAAPKRAATQPQKSIRVHVLEMLAEDDREFGLAEIIDRIHGAGIQAHDDAVRSITIKLMKDGKIERPSRGLYRLARRGRAVQNAPTPVDPAPPVKATPPAEAPAPTDAAPPAAVTEPSSAAPPVDYTPPLNLGQPWDRRS